MLKTVHRPDYKKVHFEYDALGRRTAKILESPGYYQKDEITRFVWQGNVPLHEWKYDLRERPKLEVSPEGFLEFDKAEPIPDDLITWVFDKGSFTPAAKLVRDKRYSIICDYLGTPVEAYDEDGERVWECELGIYGQVRECKGDQHFVPFRYQGQYEDEETGLYYNRFRFYDPNSGAYCSQDPIGLAGGNPNIYAYVGDSNTWVDPFGLDLVTVYHYTSAEGFKGISGTGVIKASDPGARGKGAISGGGKSKGVFVTGVEPADLQKSGLRGQMGLTKAKSTHYIEFQIDDSKLHKLDRQDSIKRLRINDDVNLRGANNKLKDGVSMGKTPCK